MLEVPGAILTLGFAIFVVGALMLNYVNLLIRRRLKILLPKRVSSRDYWSVVKAQWRYRVAIYTAAICIPVGIALSFGAIFYNNHLRMK